MRKEFDEKLKKATQTHMNESAVAGVVAFLLCLILLSSGTSKTSSQHVVKYKGNKSVAFKSIEPNDASLRVMRFKDVANGMEYYKHIEVGDTLDIKYDFNKLLTCDNYRISPFLYKVSNIRRINGKKLKEIKELAKRDSLLGRVRQSNQRVR